MSTTYDEIFECFIHNTGIDTSQLPEEDSKKYDMIKNGIKHYNVIIDVDDEVGKLIPDDNTETINVDLDDTRLLLLAYCIKYIYLENQLIAFEELWFPYQKEIGIKNYGDQIKGRERTLERVKKEINIYLTKIEDSSIM